MRYALIKNGFVQNVIVADPSFAATIEGYSHVEALDEPGEQKVAGPGWAYNAVTGEFTAPPDMGTDPGQRTISVLAFRSRFTPDEKVAIYTAAKSSVEIQIWLDDLAAAQNNEVNLDDPRTIDGANALEGAGLIGPGRAAEVLG